MNFPEMLIAYRAINRLSQTELAERLGVNTNTVFRWEKGETMPHKSTEYRVRAMIEKEVAKCQSEER